MPKRRDARSVAEALSLKIPNLDTEPRVPLTYFNVPPWAKGIGAVQVHPTLPGITSRSADQEDIRQAARRRFAEIGAEINIFTDGSALGGTTEGGAAVVITRGSLDQPEVVTTISAKGASYTCSYEEEKQAMTMTVKWIGDNASGGEVVAIFTDSQSLCSALLHSPPGLDTLSEAMAGLKNPVTIQWIPGHSKIPGNELADAAAKAATNLPDAGRGLAYGGVCSTIRATFGDPPTKHLRTAEAYCALNRGREQRLITSRRDQTLLAQLRAGKCMSLRAYRNTVDPNTNPTCDLCGLAPQDVEHWVRDCPATLQQRRNLFGPARGGLGCLSRFPSEMVALARATIGAP